MNLLAIDSSTAVLSVAVARGEEILYTETEAGMKHSELVMDYIDSQMKKAGLKPKDLDGILCMGGPGSFTGLRIGFSIAKGLALSLCIPFAPVPTLDCMALPCYNSDLVLAAMEARKNAYYYTLYRKGQRLKPDEDAGIVQIVSEIERYRETDAQKITITGAGAASLFNSLSPELKENIIPVFENRGYAREIIAIARKEKILDNDCTAYLYSGPEYIRKTDAEINLSGNAN